MKVPLVSTSLLNILSAKPHGAYAKVGDGDSISASKGERLWITTAVRPYHVIPT